jgi:hypothetical protein
VIELEILLIQYQQLSLQLWMIEEGHFSKFPPMFFSTPFSSIKFEFNFWTASDSIYHISKFQPFQSKSQNPKGLR